MWKLNDCSASASIGESSAKASAASPTSMLVSRQIGAAVAPSARRTRHQRGR